MEVINTSGRRKTSVARAYITKGKGSIEVNGKLSQIKAMMPKPAPTGEADGELYLFLIEDEA